MSLALYQFECVVIFISVLAVELHHYCRRTGLRRLPSLSIGALRQTFQTANTNNPSKRTEESPGSFTSLLASASWAVPSRSLSDPLWPSLPLSWRLGMERPEIPPGLPGGTMCFLACRPLFFLLVLTGLYPRLGLVEMTCPIRPTTVAPA
jgi:hypothetical protein